MSITLQEKERELKIVWLLDHQIPEDFSSFSKITLWKKKNDIERCSFYLIGEQEVSTLLWRSFLQSLKVILDWKIKIHFITNSKIMEETLKKFGFFLLGEISFQANIPQAAS